MTHSTPMFNSKPHLRRIRQWRSKSERLYQDSAFILMIRISVFMLSPTCLLTTTLPMRSSFPETDLILYIWQVICILISHMRLQGAYAASRHPARASRSLESTSWSGGISYLAVSEILEWKRALPISQRFECPTKRCWCKTIASYPLRCPIADKRVHFSLFH